VHEPVEQQPALPPVVTLRGGGQGRRLHLDQPARGEGSEAVQSAGQPVRVAGIVEEGVSPVLQQLGQARQRRGDHRPC
jgi:hypothetical protein